MLPQAGKAVLHHVLGFVGIAQHARSDPIERGGVALDQGGKAGVAPVGDMAHEGGIVGDRAPVAGGVSGRVSGGWGMILMLPDLRVGIIVRVRGIAA
jgi:hypothetical protein